jgi:hypothetical protein
MRSMPISRNVVLLDRAVSSIQQEQGMAMYGTEKQNVHRGAPCRLFEDGIAISKTREKGFG